MRKSILLTSLIAVLCFSVLFTAPASAYQGEKIESQEIYDTGDSYSLFLPLVIRDNGSPKLVSPANGSVINTLLPTFVWEEMTVPDGIYVRIDISKSSDFSTNDGIARPSDSVSTAETFFNLEPETLYYWRAYLYDWQNQISYPYSNVWSFTTPISGVLPVAPNLKSPTDESVIDAGPIILEWYDVPEAIEYEIWYREIGGNISYLAWEETSQFTPPNYYPMNPGASYEWWVLARNEYAYGESSEVWSFSLASDFTSDEAVKGNFDLNPIMYDEETNTFIQQ